MSDALRIPNRPNLDQYKKLAKDFRRACLSGKPDAIRNWAADWLTRRSDAEAGDDQRIVRTWEALVKRRPSAAACALTDAQFFIARAHGFASWPEFAKHIDALARESSGTTIFESAVDAIVSGDVATLARLLLEHPDLVRQRSSREHHATLLH